MYYLDMVRSRIIDFIPQYRAGDLIVDERNWRRHPFAQRSALLQLLDSYGFVGAVIARQTDAGLVLVDGHLRADLDPEAFIPVMVTDLDEAEAGRVLAIFDPLGSMAFANIEKLNQLLPGAKAEATIFLDKVLDGVNVSNLDRPAEMEVMTDPNAPPAEERPKRAPDLFLNPPVDKETMRVWPLHIPADRYPDVINLARKLAEEFGFGDDAAGLVMEVVRMAGGQR